MPKPSIEPGWLCGDAGVLTIVPPDPGVGHQFSLCLITRLKASQRLELNVTHSRGRIVCCVFRVGTIEGKDWRAEQRHLDKN